MLARTGLRSERHRGGGAHPGSTAVPAGQHDPTPRARRFGWRRLVAALSSFACVIALYSMTTGSSLGLFQNAETGGHNSVTAATVTLTNSAVANCPVTSMLPSNTAATCTFTATYAGSAAVYLAVNTLIETQSGAGGTKLYNPADGSNDLQVTVSSTSPSVTYTLPTTATTCPGGAPAGSTCYELDNELVSTSAVTSAAVAFSISLRVPTTSATGYQGGAAQVILTTHAAQSKNNTLSCSATPAAGSPCTPSGTFKWS